MSESAKIIVRRTKKGKLINEVLIKGLKSPMAIPSHFELLDESWNGKECLVTRTKGIITGIVVNGKDIPKKKVTLPQSDQKRKRVYKTRKSKPQNNSDSGDCLRSVYMLPYDTRNSVKGSYQISNFSLLLNHYIEWYGKNISKSFLGVVEKRGNGLMGDICTSVGSRIKNLIQGLSARYYVKEFSLKVQWRLSIGLGTPNVHETSLALHHVYGIPYLSASALKGIARDVAIRALCSEAASEDVGVMDKLVSLPSDLFSGKNLEKVKSVLKDAASITGAGKIKIEPKNETIEMILNGWKAFKDVRKILGTQADVGRVLLMDAFPQDLNMGLDIMNPHYSEYYTKGKPPADYYNPIPIFFLTIKKPSIFNFYLLAKKSEAEAKDLLNTAMSWLIEALQSFGVGAKTSVGYGYFNLPVRIDDLRNGQTNQ